MLAHQLAGQLLDIRRVIAEPDDVLAGNLSGRWLILLWSARPVIPRA